MSIRESVEFPIQRAFEGERYEAQVVTKTGYLAESIAAETVSGLL